MNKEGEKIKMNLVKLSHSIIVSGLSIIYLYTPNTITKNLIFFISSSYFSYDIKILLKSDSIDYPILYHHITALLLLFAFYIDYYGDLLIYLYTLAEISNIPIYITYHLKKTSPNMNIIVCSNVIQTIVYGYIRIYCFTDGFSECLDESRNEIGIEGVKQLLLDHQNSSLQKELENSTEEIRVKSLKKDYKETGIKDKNDILDDDLTIIGIGH